METRKVTTMHDDVLKELRNFIKVDLNFSR